jgi:hypothetical protein
VHPYDWHCIRACPFAVISEPMRYRGVSGCVRYYLYYIFGWHDAALDKKLEIGGRLLDFYTRVR